MDKNLKSINKELDSLNESVDNIFLYTVVICAFICVIVSFVCYFILRSISFLPSQERECVSYYNRYHYVLDECLAYKDKLVKYDLDD